MATTPSVAPSLILTPPPSPCISHPSSRPPLVAFFFSFCSASLFVSKPSSPSPPPQFSRKRKKKVVGRQLTAWHTHKHAHAQASRTKKKSYSACTPCCFTLSVLAPAPHPLPPHTWTEHIVFHSVLSTPPHLSPRLPSFLWVHSFGPMSVSSLVEHQCVKWIWTSEL